MAFSRCCRQGNKSIGPAHTFGPVSQHVAPSRDDARRVHWAGLLPKAASSQPEYIFFSCPFIRITHAKSVHSTESAIFNRHSSSPIDSLFQKGKYAFRKLIDIFTCPLL